MTTESYVAEVARGLEDLCTEELARLGAVAPAPAPAEVRFGHPRVASLLGRSRLASAFYLSATFEVPRPKALLGDAAFRRLSGVVGRVAEAAAMSSFRIAAAGADSPVFRRLAQELASATGLTSDPASGQCLVRFRRYDRGWEALVRLTPRPSSARDWRVCNLPGGANATVAAAIAMLTGTGGSYLNLMCGSGTLIVERALLGGRGEVVGVDRSAEAIACARRNIEAAGVGGVRLETGDVTADGFSAGGRFDVVAADAPWGDAVGANRENRRLYVDLFDVAARHLEVGGRFALLSHEVRLVTSLLSHDPRWRPLERRRVEHGGHNPLLVVLERRADVMDAASLS